MKKKILILLVMIVFSVSATFSREYHVTVNGSDSNDGSAAKPFKTINFAAQIAQPGDILTVHAGTYREWINPARGGENDSKRIIYQAAAGDIVEIKGSEVITGWVKEKNGVWKVTIPDAFFGKYNPYQDIIYGDWFTDNGRIHHTGEVFLNGKSLYEKEVLDKVINPQPFEGTKDKEGSIYTWYCEKQCRQNNYMGKFSQIQSK